MSRVDHIVARRQERDRKPQVVYENAGPGRRKALVFAGQVVTTSDKHEIGDRWWRSRFADLVERRRSPEKVAPKARVVEPRELTGRQIGRSIPRPADISRQAWRAISRVAEKAARRSIARGR